ncbi:MAG: formylglycine-generating enzyme family protein [Treponema sp.]|jgi:formylglycine-generating enzyme required for sulfatase activity|nr:formylglycine-generating enzyme family protein [Treponema sp.]
MNSLKRTIVFLCIVVMGNSAFAYENEKKAEMVKKYPLVPIVGGVFRMGSVESEYGRRRDERSREVTVNNFLLSPHEVTQAEYMDVMGINPSHNRGERLPVETVSWFDAVKFCNKLSEREGLEPAYIIRGQKVIWDRGSAGYRLPTEAEWEFACRANTMTAFSTGDVLTTDQANYYGRKTLPVESFSANGFGIFDMHGNVWEWCWDGYSSYSREIDNPVTEQNAVCVVRGGSFRSTALDARSASRGSSAVAYRSWDTGFRVARNLEEREWKDILTTESAE